MKILSKVAIAAASLAAVSAQAATVSFTDFVYNNTGSTNQIDYIVTVDDTSVANSFTFNVSVDSNSTATGDILGFGLGFGAFTGPVTVTNFTAGVDNDLGGSLGSQGTGTSCGGGCNWNGTSFSPNYSFQVSDTGSAGSEGLFNSFSLSIASNGLTLDGNTFAGVGIRTQALGAYPNGGDGSAKDYSTTPSVVTAVPELSASVAPVSLALLAGLMLMGVERRRKAA